MTTLVDIRDIETRLHSHCLEWDDRPLIDELMYLLDELQYIHEDLDRCQVPNTDPSHLELSLRQRVKSLASTCHARAATRECRLDFYGQQLEVTVHQIPLPISPHRKDTL